MRPSDEYAGAGRPIAEHHVVVDRLAARDADGAEDALRTHLRMVLCEVPRIRAAHPDFFDAA